MISIFTIKQTIISLTKNIHNLKIQTIINKKEMINKSLEDNNHIKINIKAISLIKTFL
jgi:hypothetical protein